MFNHDTAIGKFEKQEDEFRNDETVDKFHGEGQVTICVCTRNVSVRDTMCAMSVTPCVTTWFGITPGGGYSHITSVRVGSIQ